MQNHSKLSINSPWCTYLHLRRGWEEGLKAILLDMSAFLFPPSSLSFPLACNTPQPQTGPLHTRLGTPPHKSYLAFLQSSACISPPGIASSGFTPWWTDLLHLLKTLWVWSNWSVCPVFSYSSLLLRDRPKKSRNSTLSGWAVGF